MRVRLGCGTGIVAALGMMVACGSDASNQPPIGDDAGTSPPVDKTDAATPDAATDDVDAGPPPPITVTVVSSGGDVVAGDRVLFHDATGAITGETTTDTQGIAKFDDAPAMVTVLDTLSKSLSTFVGVKPGDSLKVIAGFPNGTPAGHIHATFAADAVQAGDALDLYLNRHLCGSTNVGTSELAVLKGCLRPQNHLFGLLGPATGRAYVFAKNIVPPAVDTTLEVGPLTAQLLGTRTLVANNLPAGLDPSQLIMTGQAVAGVEAFDMPRSAFDAAAGTATFGAPVAFAEGYLGQVGRTADTTTDPGKPALISSTRIVRREAATPATGGALTTGDLAEALPLVESVSLSSTTSTTRPIITIGITGATKAHSGFAAIYTMAAGSTTRAWVIVFPGDSKTIQFPALPTDAEAQFAPTANAQIVGVGYIDGTVAPDYDAFRRFAFSNYDSPFSYRQRTLPANGTILKSMASLGGN